MKNIVLIHVDYGSKGNGGLYIRKTVSSLIDLPLVKCITYVHYDFIYELESKRLLFGKFSSRIKSPLLNKIYKAINIYHCLCKVSFNAIYLKLLRNKRVKVVISLNTPWVHYVSITYFLKLFSIDYYYILHDVQDLSIDAPSLIITDRSQLIKNAKGVIVHTEESALYAKSFNSNVSEYPFPLMDLSVANNFNRDSYIPTFLFIGSIRPEKGVQLLIDALIFLNESFDFNVIIAGKSYPGHNLSIPNNPNFTRIDEFLSDNLYSELISKCHYVVLPYLQGTNSGILSTVVSTNTPVICSSLEMFSKSQFVPSDNVFSVGDLDSLINIIKNKLQNFDDNYANDKLQVIQALSGYEQEFKSRVLNVYSKILNE